MKNVMLSAMLALSTTTLFADNNIKIYPNPQKMAVLDGFVNVKDAQFSSNFDSNAKTLLQQFINHNSNSNYLISINEATTSARCDLKNCSGAYNLKITKNKITINSYDATGTFYAIQTLRQLNNNGKFPLIEINDYPDIPFRGAVEGFYGKPWPHKDRLAQLDFYGKYKLNTYIYGPKNDPFHGFSTRWREPYPAKEAERISELIKRAKKNKVNFVWAVHPGRDIKWTKADFEATIKKFEMMYELGVRSFAVFFDDIGGEGARAEKQIEYLNELKKRFIDKKSDVTPLIFCPTQYSRAYAKGDYLTQMGQKLDPAINMMWTGNSVIHNITLEGNQWFEKRTKRPPFIWWNWPVSDYVREHLLIGRTYGLAQGKGAIESMSGFTSNPMDKPEASKIALFSIADYTWNVNDFNSVKSWKDGIKIMFPKSAAAMQTFANHNSSIGKSVHHYQREESVEIAKVFNRFLKQYQKNNSFNSNDFSLIKEEFTRIATAAQIIRRNNPDKQTLFAEINPWLNSFTYLGRAGLKTLDLTEKLAFKPQNNKANIEKNFTLLQNIIAQLNNMSGDDCREDKQHNYRRPPVETGSKVIKPFVHNMSKNLFTELYATANNKKSSKLNFSTMKAFSNSKNKDNINKMIDANVASYYYCRQVQKVGDWFGIDLGSDIAINRINLIMGRYDGDHDIVHRGQLEYATDSNKNNWIAINSPTEGDKISLTNLNIKARYLRYRSLHAGKLDGTKNNVWTAIRDFKVNEAPLPFVVNTVTNLQKPILKLNKNGYSLNQIHEVGMMGKNQYIQINIPEGVAGRDIRNFQVNLGVKNINTWGEKLAATDDDNFINFSKISPNKIYKKFRFINRKNKIQNIKIKTFKIILDESLFSLKNANDKDILTFSSLKNRQAIFTNDSKEDTTANALIVLGQYKSGKITLKGVNSQKTFSLSNGDHVDTFRLDEPIKEVVVNADSNEMKINELVFIQAK
ncbi:beta-N-acetylglucosaminidase domain-containing protein [Lentisphaerota bacterium WC36G]|nr:beta-N-acetylglucosaminidase domain-containing protein [Lentisphaerae bacterium WC36]